MPAQSCPSSLAGWEAAEASVTMATLFRHAAALRRPSWPLALAVASALVFTGCGGGSGESQPTTPTLKTVQSAFEATASSSSYRFTGTLSRPGDRLTSVPSSLSAVGVFQSPNLLNVRQDDGKTSLELIRTADGVNFRGTPDQPYRKGPAQLLDVWDVQAFLRELAPTGRDSVSKHGDSYEFRKVVTDQWLTGQSKAAPVDVVVTAADGRVDSVDTTSQEAPATKRHFQLSAFDSAEASRI